MLAHMCVYKCVCVSTRSLINHFDLASTFPSDRGGTLAQGRERYYH